MGIRLRRGWCARGEPASMGSSGDDGQSLSGRCWRVAIQNRTNVGSTERLGQALVGPELMQAATHRRAHVCGHDADARGAKVGLGPNPSANIKSIESGHDQVKEHEVGPKREQQRARAEPIRRSADLQMRRHAQEHSLHHLNVQKVVIARQCLGA